MLGTRLKFLDLVLIVMVWSGIIPFLVTPYFKYAVLALAFYQLIILLYLTLDKITFKVKKDG